MLALTFASHAAMAEALPTRVATCARTTIRSVQTRLVEGNGRPVPGSGSAVRLANGGYQVGYDMVPAVEASRPGDPVIMCLISIPRDCPPGDARGRSYTVTNLRTEQSWTLSDSPHRCGGA